MEIHSIILVLQIALATPSLFRTFSYLTRSKERRHDRLHVHEDANGAATRNSIRSFAAARVGLAIWIGALGGLASTIPANVLGYTRASHGYTLSWILLAIQSTAVLTAPLDASRDVPSYELHGALSSLVLAVYILSTVVSEGVPIISPWTQWSGAASALITLVGFISLPRRPTVFFRGKPVDREDNGSLLEQLMFSWARNLLTETVGLDDLPCLGAAARSARLTERYSRLAGSGSLWWTLARLNSRPLALQWTSGMLKSGAAVAPKLATFCFLQSLETRSTGVERVDTRCVLLVLVLGLANGLSVWAGAWSQWVTETKLAIPIQATISSLVYQKALRLPNVANVRRGSDSKTGNATGQESADQKSILNHLRLDGATGAMTFTRSDRIILTLTKLALTTTFLSRLIGWGSVLIGVFCLVVTMPLVERISARYAETQSTLAKCRDERTGLLSESLQAIRQIKLISSEDAWATRILNCRTRELEQVAKSAVWMCSLVFAANIGPIILAGVPLFVLALRNEAISTSVAFTCVDLFEQLQDGVSTMPLLWTYLLDAWASLRRLEEYLGRNEASNEIVASGCIAFEEATIVWSQEGVSEKGTFMLKDVSLRIPRGELSIITGDTGTGKSLLLSAILGEAKVLSGTVSFPQPYESNGSDSPSPFSVVSQNPWIENDTIRNNILFGLPLEEDRYMEALNNCALDKDISAMTEGDLTVVGAKGAALSGGQRWRVALARALYSRSEMIVLDDVLGAVDAEVRSWLVKRALSGGLARGRTRVLATHHWGQCVSGASCVVRIESGEVHQEYQPASGAKVATFDDVDEPSTGSTWSLGPGGKGSHKALLEKATQKVVSSDDGNPKQRGARADTRGAAARHYRHYFFASGGLWTWCLVCFPLLVVEVLGITKAWWLREWTSRQLQPAAIFSQGSLLSDAGIYLALSSLTCLAFSVRCGAWYFIGIKASRVLFDDMARSVLGTDLQWLEATPHGEVIQRFTTDTNTVDARLPHNVGFMIECVSGIISILVTSLSISPALIGTSAALLYAYYKIGTRLIAVSRNLKRLNSETTASLYEQLSSLLAPDGPLTVRAFGAQNYLANRMHDLIDKNSSVAWHHALCCRAMDVQLGALGSLLVGSVALAAVLVGADAGTAGVALAFGVKLTGMVSGLLQRAATVDAGLQSAGRMAEYGGLEGETTSGDVPDDAWPQHGGVVVRGLVAGYSPSAPTTLKDISFFIRPGMRVGVVGRTGAGKSSLVLALKRLIPRRTGEIILDGVDIEHVRLDGLRKRIFVIPQDPYLFPGTLRSTVDPQGQHGDEIIRATLVRLGLGTESIASEKWESKGGTDLDSPVLSGGQNLSRGERQLLLLAAAALAKPKLIIMDEATGAVDAQTDAAVQKFLKDKLAGSTVIVVAHRVETVSGFDEVLVMDGGRVVEGGSPEELMERRGYFWKLVRHGGEA